LRGWCTCFRWGRSRFWCLGGGVVSIHWFWVGWVVYRLLALSPWLWSWWWVNSGSVCM